MVTLRYNPPITDPKICPTRNHKNQITSNNDPRWSTTPSSASPGLQECRTGGGSLPAPASGALRARAPRQQQRLWRLWNAKPRSWNEICGWNWYMIINDHKQQIKNTCSNWKMLHYPNLAVSPIAYCFAELSHPKEKGHWSLEKTTATIWFQQQSNI